jgi:hypothetical protein
MQLGRILQVWKKKDFIPQGYARKIRPTQGVSYPRSGHGIVFRIARRYFGEAFVYCDTNNVDHCGCESVPCINPKRTFAKNHDFSLRSSGGVPVIPSERYLIQFRNPVRAIASDYYIFRSEKLLNRRKSEWRRFALDSINYWNRFVDKWILKFPPEAALPFYCSYESLLSDPHVRIREILSFLGEDPLEDDEISRILKIIPIVNKDSISKFRYYDKGFFREIEARTAGRLERLRLPSFDEGY